MNKKKDRKIKDMRKSAALLVFFLLLLIIGMASARRVTSDSKQELAATKLYEAAFEGQETEPELVDLEDQAVPLAAVSILLEKTVKKSFNADKAAAEMEQKALDVKAAVSELEIDKELVEQRKNTLLAYIRRNVFPYGAEAVEAVREAVIRDAESKKIVNGNVIDDSTAEIVDSALTMVGSEKETE